MAIEKTYIDDENIDTAFTRLFKYLETAAVPEYFSKVENSGTVISCYNNDVLMMTIEYPMYEKGVTIYTKNSTSINISTDLSSCTRLKYGYKYGNGISFQIASSSSSSADYPSALAITKDESGNTVIIAENHLHPILSTSGNIPVYIINSDSDEISPLRLVRHLVPNFSKTVLVPLVVLGTNGNYTPNAFVQMFGRNTEQGTLEINGTKYFSNGLWCIKDE